MATTIAPTLAPNLSRNGTFTTSFDYKGGLCRLETTTGVYAYGVFLTLLAVVATIENAIVLIVLYRNPILRQPSILILGILALLDFITASVVTPLKVWFTLIEARSGSETMVSIQSLASTFLWLFLGVVYFSLSTVLLISVDRFLRVSFLEKYVLTLRKLLFSLILAWSIPLIITVCLAVRHYRRWLAWLSLVYFLFCILGMILAYLGMVVMLKKHRSTITDTTTLDFRKCIEDEKRSVNTTLIIVCTCLAMNIPPIASIVAGFNGLRSRKLCAITFFVMLGNSAVNPIIYCLRVPLIRRHILQFLGVKVLRKYEDDSDDYLTVVADGENCNIYTGPRHQSNQEDA